MKDEYGYGTWDRYFGVDKKTWCSNCRIGTHKKCKKIQKLKNTGELCQCECLPLQNFVVDNSKGRKKRLVRQ